MPKLAEQLGIAEDTPKYPNDGVFRHVYLNCLAAVVDRETRKTLIEPEEFEVIIIPETSEMDDGFVMEDAALYRARAAFAWSDEINQRMEAMDRPRTSGWFVDMTLMWQFPIPINKLHLHPYER